MRARIVWILAALAAAAVGIGAVLWQAQRGAAPAPEATSPVAKVVTARFVGVAACNGCHAAEHAAWNGSDHDLAMQVADDKSVLGDFADAKFAYAGTTSTFFRRDGKFFVNTDGPDGKLQDYEIKYTFGVRPLQQYLIEFPGGRMQALSIAWDSRPKAQGGQRWFHLYPGQNIPAGDPLHWTGSSRTGTSCAPSAIRRSLPRTSTPRRARSRRRGPSSTSAARPATARASDHVAWARRRATGGRIAAGKGLAIALDERRASHWTPIAATGNARRSVPRHERPRDRHLRALPCPREPHLRRLRPRQAAPRHASSGAARRQPVLERRPDARRGLQLGLVPAEQDARRGRHLFATATIPIR